MTAQPYATGSYDDELYRSVRAAFTLQGSSLRGHCLDRGVHPQNARAALLGIWTGPAAEQLIGELCKAAGVER